MFCILVCVAFCLAFATAYRIYAPFLNSEVLVLFFSQFFWGCCCLGFFYAIRQSKFSQTSIVLSLPLVRLRTFHGLYDFLFPNYLPKLKHWFSQGLRILSQVITMIFLSPLKPSKIQDGFVSCKPVTNFSFSIFLGGL